MQTIEFFKLIESHPQKLLRFRDHRNALVHPAYHISEVKAGSFQTVDCGNVAHEWNETILQLWLSDDPDAERAMGAAKATGILAKVSQKIDIDPESELRIEYGNEEFPAVQFNVGEITVGEAEIVVALIPPSTGCKLEERGGSCARPTGQEAAATSCCESGKSDCCA
jgi:hypothetical protein